VKIPPGLTETADQRGNVTLHAHSADRRLAKCPGTSRSRGYRAWLGDRGSGWWGAGGGQCARRRSGGRSLSFPVYPRLDAMGTGKAPA
jgi:hypothetical protein